MEAIADPRLIARQPRQERSRKRFEAMLDASRSLLLEEGLAGFSIPALAERLDYTRASVYQYFPTPYALLNELMNRELVELQKLLQAESDKLAGLRWQDTLARIVHLAADFHNSHPIGRMLILGGPLSDEGQLAQNYSMQQLAGLARALLAERGIDLPAVPDVALLTVEIGTSCMRVAFQTHGVVTPAYRDETIRVMTAYLAQHTGVDAD